MSDGPIRVNFSGEHRGRIPLQDPAKSTASPAVPLALRQEHPRVTEYYHAFMDTRYARAKNFTAYGVAFDALSALRRELSLEPSIDEARLILAGLVRHSVDPVRMYAATLAAEWASRTEPPAFDPRLLAPLLSPLIDDDNGIVAVTAEEKFFDPYAPEYLAPIGPSSPNNPIA